MFFFSKKEQFWEKTYFIDFFKNLHFLHKYNHANWNNPTTHEIEARFEA